MAFPTGTQITTSNLDSDTDSPSLARADLLTAVEALNAIIASANGASGVLVLTGAGKIPAGIMPQSITLPQGVQIINPASLVVNIRDFLRIQPQTVEDMDAFTEQAQGDICFLTDGDSGNPCLAVYDGTDWRIVALGAVVA
jgi:hypothetical protein